MNLLEHLKRFGIIHFNDEEYWKWGGEILSKSIGEKGLNKLDKLRNPISKGKATPSEKLAFYNFIAKREIAAVSHSMKADAIRSSCEAITGNIKYPKSILDIGCNTGHITSWYSISFPGAKIIGIDISDESVKTANNFFSELKLKNIQAIVGSPEIALNNISFDYIVDSQSVYESFNRKKILLWISNQLKSGSSFITVPQTPNIVEFSKYIKEIEDFGMQIIYFQVVSFSDLGNKGAYPLLVVKSGVDNASFESNIAFKTLLQSIAGST